MGSKKPYFRERDRVRFTREACAQFADWTDYGEATARMLRMEGTVMRSWPVGSPRPAIEGTPNTWYLILGSETRGPCFVEWDSKHPLTRRNEGETSDQLERIPAKRVAALFEKPAPRLVSQVEYEELYTQREAELDAMPGGAQGALPDMSDVELKDI